MGGDEDCFRGDGSGVCDRLAGSEFNNFGAFKNTKVFRDGGNEFQGMESRPPQ